MGSCGRQFGDEENLLSDWNCFDAQKIIALDFWSMDHDEAKSWEVLSRSFWLFLHDLRCCQLPRLWGVRGGGLPHLMVWWNMNHGLLSSSYLISYIIFYIAFYIVSYVLSYILSYNLSYILPQILFQIPSTVLSYMSFLSTVLRAGSSVQWHTNLWIVWVISIHG